MENNSQHSRSMLKETTNADKGGQADMIQGRRLHEKVGLACCHYGLDTVPLVTPLELKAGITH